MTQIENHGMTRDKVIVKNVTATTQRMTISVLYCRK